MKDEYEKVKDAETKRPRFSFAEQSDEKDAHVVITRPDVVKPGLRLGDWSQVEK